MPSEEITDRSFPLFIKVSKGQLLAVEIQDVISKQQKYLIHKLMPLKISLKFLVTHLSDDKQIDLMRVSSIQNRIRSRICQTHDFVRNHLHLHCCNSFHQDEMLSC